MSLVARTAGNPVELSSAVRNRVSSIDKDQPVATIRTMERVVSDSVASQRFSMMLLGVFASVALILAAIGLYGVMAYAVTQQTREIGIRMALGAQARDMLKLVIGKGMTLVVIGVGIGLAASFALTRLMKTLLFDVSATDPLTFAAVVLLLLSIALLACYLPARRATKVDPMVALRYE
jgi:putative ABC transport system permease protein